MRIITTAVGLLILSCSSGSGVSQVSPGNTANGGTGSTDSGNINVGTGQRDCTTATDKEGCFCATLNEQRDCQIGTCPGKQSCMSNVSGEISSNSWGACNVGVPGPTCSTADGAGGTNGGGGMSHGGGGKGSTADGAAGKRGSSEGAAGKGTTGDGPLPSLCSNDKINNEPEILVGYSPSNGQSVGQNGQIKVWINDEGAPFISPNEVLDPTTGAITTPGDHTAKAPDGYLWEPALYISPATAESGGTPHFPQFIKGWYSYPGRGKNAGIQGAPTEPVPGNPSLSEKYTAEDIWDVRALGLAPGNYIGEFVIWDGDTDRAVGCVSIVITP